MSQRFGFENETLEKLRATVGNISVAAKSFFLY